MEPTFVARACKPDFRNATARDFEHPVASFEVDQSGWEIVYKLMGTTWSCSQEHSPFDVVAWHGNCGC